MNNFFGGGLRETAAMIWMTWWPLVLGFTLSGLVQSMVPRRGLRRSLGRDSLAAALRASGLGIISSSCSYAASAMARALFSRGATWRNSLIFMIASTNLVLELGIVLYFLLGGSFVLAQVLGGAVMISLVTLGVSVAFPRDVQVSLAQKVSQSAPAENALEEKSFCQIVISREAWLRGSRFTRGDLTMVWRELALGFLVAGFLSANLPASWWHHLFLNGHGWLTMLENVLIAPLVAVIAFVCSVGNIPLAAALWLNGVSFGGVISFIFADLITLPLLLIYRRFYGTATAWRLALFLWGVMSLGGLLTELLFRAAHLVPKPAGFTRSLQSFDTASTLYLNIAASLILLILLVMSRGSSSDSSVAIDPICGMQVDTAAPAATAEYQGQRYYFCAPRCAEKFAANPSDVMREDTDGDALDPICGMRVNSRHPDVISSYDGKSLTTYFCSRSCRETFLTGKVQPPSQPVSLQPKPPRG